MAVRSLLRLFCALLILSLALLVSAVAQSPSNRSPSATDEGATSPDNQPIKRLILTDGSYQPATRWEVRGDRVRYFSAERNQWEEVPNAMVDWKATEAYNSRTASSKAPEEAKKAEEKEKREQEEEEERKEKAELDASNPEVAPGLRLPDGGGVYLLDTFRNKPELIELVQNSTSINNNKAHNVLRAAINPLAKNKQTIELPGLHARIQAHVPDPVLYVKLEDDDRGGASGSPSQRFRLVRVSPQLKKDNRVIGTIEFALYSGTSQKQHVIETEATPLAAGWVKVAPKQPLVPGEYALVEMLGKEVNLDVWDWGINPVAPENPARWTPEEPKKKKEKEKDKDKEEPGFHLPPPISPRTRGPGVPPGMPNPL